MTLFALKYIENSFTINQQEALNYALLLRGMNKTIPEIQQHLEERGVSQLDAQLIAGQAYELGTGTSDIDIQERNKAANRKIIIGCCSVLADS